MHFSNRKRVAPIRVKTTEMVTGTIIPLDLCLDAFLVRNTDTRTHLFEFTGACPHYAMRGF